MSIIGNPLVIGGNSGGGDGFTITTETDSHGGIIKHITGTPTVVSPLSVTQNGTYTPTSGNAYGPVTVNVSGGGVTATATVQVKGPTNDWYQLYGAFINIEDVTGWNADAIGTLDTSFTSSFTSHTVALRQGATYMTAYVPFANVFVTGNVTVQDDPSIGLLFTITGDCTIDCANV